MDFNDFLDEYGFLSDFSKIIHDSGYSNLTSEEKKEVLIKLIDINFQRRNTEIIKRLEERGKLTVPSRIEEKETLKDIERGIKINQSDFAIINLNNLMQCSSLDDIKNLGLLPDKNTEYGIKEIKRIILSLHLELEEYKLIELEEKEDFFTLEKEKIENLLEILIDYISYDEEVDIEVQNDFSVFYLPNNLSFDDENNSSPVIKDVSKNKKQDVIISMINSIKKQEFKGLKRFGNPFSDFYELRNGEQRVVFNFIDSNTCFIIFAFTKKSDNDKRYRLELSNRINKYRKMKTQLKRAIKKEVFIVKQAEIDSSIAQIVQKEKVLIKEEGNIYE